MSLRHFPPTLIACVPVLLATSCGGSGGGMAAPPPPPPPPPPASNSPYWAQWALSPRHDGQVSVAGSSLGSQQADITYDPFVTMEQAEQGGDLVAHYPATLIDGSDFYIEKKTGSYVACSPAGNWRSGAACGPNAWNSMIWNVARYQWQSGAAAPIWTFASDWKPEPNGRGLAGWEPVFHPALANSAIYVPGAGGTLWKVNKTTGQSLAHIDPFAGTGVNPAHTYVSGPLTADAGGNIYYNVIELTAVAGTDPWFGADVVSAWLVKVSPTDAASRVSYATLLPGAPAAAATTCAGSFGAADALPWPPSPSARPASLLCGSQRPGVNVAPAIAPDGTIFTISRAHFDEQVAYVVAVNPDLSPKWQASMERRLADGCGFLVPIATDLVTPNSCRPGTTPGVDPTTNDLGSGSVTDLSSSTPTALPDGGVLYGAMTYYNGFRGHLFKFDALGAFVASYPFGWDSTPAVYAHGGTYSIVIKDNNYGTGLYCTSGYLCAPALTPGPFYITQLDAGLNIEWQFQNTTIDPANPNGYEWCINAPAIDSAGVVYVNGEDGYAYAIGQPPHNGIFTTPLHKKFLRLAIGAAYTPLSIGPDGRVYTQNDGHLFVLGN
jgi:hypothetical protein